MRQSLLALGFIPLLAVSAAQSQAQEQMKDWPDPEPITILDPAPALDLAHMVKGEDVSTFQKDRIYVVEFWATWCGPCRAGMPHLSELQRQYLDHGVTIVGISDEKLQTIVDFLLKADWNQKMQYSVATDPDRSAWRDYMEAAAQRGIPTAFIVGRGGLIEWIGHPMGMDEPLAAVVAGTWDADSFKKTFEEKQRAARVAQKHFDQMSKAREAKDWNAVLEELDALAALGPQFAAARIDKYVLLNRELQRPKEAEALARAFMTEHWDKPQMLNHLAWIIVDEPGLHQRHLEIALQAARRANDLTQQADSGIMDTLARAFFELGQVDEAIAWQLKAIDQSPGEPLTTQLKEALAKYHAAKK